MAAPQISPELIFESSDWLVLNKPAGWLTIPGRPGKEADPTAASPVLSEWAKAQYGNVWVVHRIDRETSGVVLLARNADAHRRANIWFEKHEVKKNYDCLATGVPRMPVFKIQKPIEGQASVTQVEVRESYEEGFLARVMLRTGRRHQIRIHLAGEGHPLWGDTLYRGPKTVRIGSTDCSIGRVALHAAKLEIPGGATFEAPWPEDFRSWVEALREGGRRVGT